MLVWEQYNTLGILNMIQVATINLEESPLTWPSQHTMCVIHAILWVQMIIMIPLHIMVIAVHHYLIVYHQKLKENRQQTHYRNPHLRSTHPLFRIA